MRSGPRRPSTMLSSATPRDAARAAALDRRVERASGRLPGPRRPGRSRARCSTAPRAGIRVPSCGFFSVSRPSPGDAPRAPGSRSCSRCAAVVLMVSRRSRCTRWRSTRCRSSRLSSCSRPQVSSVGAASHQRRLRRHVTAVRRAQRRSRPRGHPRRCLDRAFVVRARDRRCALTRRRLLAGSPRCAGRGPESVRDRSAQLAAALASRDRGGRLGGRPVGRRVLDCAAGVPRPHRVRPRRHDLPDARVIRCRPCRRPARAPRRDRAQPGGDHPRLPAREQRRPGRAPGDAGRRRPWGAPALARHRRMARRLPLPRAWCSREDRAAGARAAPRAWGTTRLTRRARARGRALPRPGGAGHGCHPGPCSGGGMGQRDHVPLHAWLLRACGHGARVRRRRRSFRQRHARRRRRARRSGARSARPEGR